MPSDHLMRAAWALAARGMYIFPLRPVSKIPAVRRDWEGCATTDVEQIGRWWMRAPYNIGVATGPSRLLVIDLDAPKRTDPDRHHGRQALAALADAAHAVVPTDTLTVATPGGQHLYFRAPEGRVLTNTAGRLGRKIDTRARGGYVVGPGSWVAGHRYRIVHDADPVPVPDWITEALRPAEPDRLPATAANAHPAYVKAALDGEARRVVEAPTGRRNITLFQAAARLGRFVRAGQLRGDDVIRVLGAAAARHVGVDRFTVREVHRTIDSGLRHAGSVAPPQDRAPKRATLHTGRRTTVPPAGRRSTSENPRRPS